MAMPEQALQGGALRLDAVEREEVLAVAGLQEQAVGIVAAAELAVVLLQAVMPGGEAACRKRQRQSAEAPDLGRKPAGHRVDAADRIERQLYRRHPAVGAQLGVFGQRGGAVDVQVRAQGMRAPAGLAQDLQRGGVARLDRELVLLADASQGAQLGLAHHQGHGGQAHVLAGGAQLTGDG